MMHEIKRIPYPISEVLQEACKPLITQREAAMMDYCHKLGEVHAGFIDGILVCCWGLIPGSFLSEQAYLWMWSPGPIAQQFTFIRQSQIQVRQMLYRYPTILGHCKRTSRSAQRWLRWLGAEFEPTDADVIPFTIRRSI